MNQTTNQKPIADVKIGRFNRILSWIGWFFVIIFFLSVAVILTTRYVVVPKIAESKPLIEQKLSTLLNQPVHIGSLKTGWYRLNPYFEIDDIQIGENSDKTTAQKAIGILSYRSLIHLTPVFARLQLDKPQLNITRTADNKLSVLGFEIDPNVQSSTESFSFEESLNWYFKQREILITQGQIDFIDYLGQQRQLSLQDINIGIQNGPIFKKIGLQITPPSEIAKPFDIRAKFKPSFGSLPNNPHDWKGTVYGDLPYINFQKLKEWLPQTVLNIQGEGSGHLWVELNHWKLEGFSFIGALSNLSMHFSPELKELHFDYLKGKIKGSLTQNEYRFSTNDFVYKVANENPSPSLEISGQIFTKENDLSSAKIQANIVKISEIVKLFPSLPLPNELKKFVNQRNLGGTIQNLSVLWDGSISQPTRYEASLEFIDLQSDGASGKNNGPWLPGFRHLTGNLQATSKGGTIRIKSKNAQVSFPGIFPVASFRLNQLDAESSWSIGKDLTPSMITLKRIHASSDEIQFDGTGSYRRDGSPFGYLDLNLKNIQGKATSAWKYVPNIAGKETILWLKRALLSGTASNGHATVRGPLHEFPWTLSNEHSFKTVFDFKDVTLDVFPTNKTNSNGTWKHGAIWPVFERVSGTGTFAGESMMIEAKSGRYQKASISNVLAEIPAFSAKPIWLNIEAKASGDINSFLHYANHSPVTDYTGGIFTKANGSGNGLLSLMLKIPFDSNYDASVDGSFTAQNNDLAFNQFSIPSLRKINGTVHFSEKGADSKELKANILGEAVSATLATHKNGTLQVNAKGTLPAGALHQVLPGTWTPELTNRYFAGKTPFKVVANIRDSVIDVDIQSSLVGMSSKLPTPLTKSQATENPLAIKVQAKKDTLAVHVDIQKIGQTQLVLKNNVLKQGTFGFPIALPMPSRGISINADLQTFSLEEWTDLAPKVLDFSSDTKTPYITFPEIDTVKIDIDHLFIRNFNQDQFHLNAQRSPQGWIAHVESQQTSGNLEWQQNQKGKTPQLIAHFSKLLVPNTLDAVAQEAKPVDIQGGWPAINAIIEDFAYGDVKLGRIELNAINTPSMQGHLWQIKKLNIQNSDQVFTSSGSWLKGFDGNNRTTLLLDNRIKNLGGVLSRIGMSNLIRNGRGIVKGELSWEGTPLGFNRESFDGALEINLSKGDIQKIQPGAGAKLLSLLSLQSLTRYLTLDFRDFYSKGFTFDTIVGKTTIDNGHMDLKELTVVGTSASIVISGLINIQEETQDLDILVLPDINASGASIALAVANPIVGVGSFIAQLLFKNPLSKLFSFEYHVTGTWSDPIVQKIERQVEKPSEILYDLNM